MTRERATARDIYPSFPGVQNAPADFANVPPIVGARSRTTGIAHLPASTLSRCARGTGRSPWNCHLVAVEARVIAFQRRRGGVSWVLNRRCLGGGERNRTADLIVANDAL